MKKGKEFFDGYYFKHQKDKNTLCVIAGNTQSEKFIQVITDDFSVRVPFTNCNKFSEKGIKLNIKTDTVSVAGKILYSDFSPIKYDIMGPFKYFPMECRHGILSMRHGLTGSMEINGKTVDFTGGTGYIEKDSGASFPSSYVWVHANDFYDGTSIVASVADIPFMGFNFKGCICVILYKGKEIRLATYLGAKIVSCGKNEIILKQGKYRLEIKIHENRGFKLSAPVKGEMMRTITETASCRADFTLFVKDKTVFDKNQIVQALNMKMYLYEIQAISSVVL